MSKGDKPGPIRRRLSGSIGKHRLLKLTTDGGDEPISAFPLAVSRHVAAVLQMDDFRPDGLTFLPLGGISRVRRNAGDRSFERRVLALGRLPAELPTVALGSGRWPGALDPLQQQGAIVEVHRRGRDKTLLGYVVSLSSEALSLRLFDEHGSFDHPPEVVPWSTIDAVATGTDYIEVYARFLASGEGPLQKGDLAVRAGATDLAVPAGDPIAVRAALERAAGTRQYVRIHRRSGLRMGLVPLAVGPELFLACPMRELVPDGVEVLRLRDVLRVESGPSEHSKTFLLRREGRLPGPAPEVDLSSIAGALASAGPIVILEHGDADFFLGRLLEQGEHRSRGQFLTIDRGWFDEPEDIDHDTVTRIELDSDYLRAFNHDLPGLPVH